MSKTRCRRNHWITMKASSMRSVAVVLSVVALASCAHHPEPAPATPTAVARPLATAAPEANTYRVHVIDVGTGLSVFVRGSDFSLLYDAGSYDDLARGPANRVVAFLKAAEPDLTTIDHVILSHPHRDHVELLADVIAAYEIRNVWDSGVVNPVCGYRGFSCRDANADD
jgi:beta-lactamase superfamily II metal-dependent hydrolase